MSSDITDKAREEFFSEAQEIVEGLSRDLLSLDEASRKGHSEPDLVNDVFRAVHTLKGLAGLFGAQRMSTVSHDLEEVLDDLRLGKIDLSRDVLDLLFRAVDVYGLLLVSEKTPGLPIPAEIDGLIAELSSFAKKSVAPEPASGGGYELDAGLLAVLTEYEEHRLRTNIASGFALYRIRATFNLMTIDEELDRLKAAAKPFGEIITYLPTGDGGDAETIDLEVLMASKAELSRLMGAIGSAHVKVEAVARREATSTPTPPPILRRATVDLDSIPAPPSREGHPSDASELRPVRDASPAGLSLRSVSQTVRVDIRKLDTLMNIVGELAIVRSSLSRITERVRSNPGLRELGFELYRLQRGFERHLGDMQDGILEVRMVPVGQIFDKLGRVARQASRDAGKQVNLVITGAETEVDKLIVEELSDPLMHMVRNAIDHGIEALAERTQAGKPDTGTIAINAFQKGSHVVIEIEDDGRGMDPAKLVETAKKRGFLSEEEARDLGEREAFGLIFLPGFTTKVTADMLAGRGVGMDIVRTNIARLGGVVDVQSEWGIGTKMTITLPITLAILSALIVHVGVHAFAVPLSSVQEALVHDGAAVRTIDGREVLTLRGESLPLARLSRLFAIDPSPKARGFIVVVAVGKRRLGLIVDWLEGQQDIVIKPLGPSLAEVRGFAGAAQLGDQRVGLVLDTPALVDEVLEGVGVGKTPLGARRDVA